MTACRIIPLLAWLALASAQVIGGPGDFGIFPFPSENENTIVNGQQADPGEFPSYAVFSGGVLCGGVVVAEDIILTAAHCVDGDFPPAVRIGGTTSGDGELVDVVDGVIHPNYRASTLENDIAILVLAEATSAPIATYNTDRDFPAGGEAVVAVGFGRTNPNSGGGSSTLQKLDMEAVNDEQCEDEYSDHQADFNICVDNDRGGICFGDSGGPLYDANGLVLGVASFIIQTCDSNFPDFYTRVSSYSNWVQRSICSESANPSGNCDEIGDDDGPDGEADDCLLTTIFDCFTALCDLFLGG